MVINIMFLVLLLIVVAQIFKIVSGIYYFFILGIEILIIIFLWLKIKGKWSSRECNNPDCDRNLVEMMKKYRHDMLNNFQVISCYATLNRNEEIVSYISSINYTAKQQSLIAAFSNNSIAAYFYKIHVLYPDLIIELELEEEINYVQQRFNQEMFLNICKEMIDSLYKVVDKQKEQHLTISIGKNENSLILNLEFEGNIKEVADDIAIIQDKLLKMEGKYILGLINEQKYIVDLHFPLKQV